jgi:hypothetical protein
MTTSGSQFRRRVVVQRRGRRSETITPYYRGIDIVGEVNSKTRGSCVVRRRSLRQDLFACLSVYSVHERARPNIVITMSKTER